MKFVIFALFFAIVAVAAVEAGAVTSTDSNLTKLLEPITQLIKDLIKALNEFLRKYPYICIVSIAHIFNWISKFIPFDLICNFSKTYHSRHWSHEGHWKNIVNSWWLLSVPRTNWTESIEIVFLKFESTTQ